MLQDERHVVRSSGIPGDVTLASAAIAAILGIVVGISGPLFFVFIGPGIIAGPTWGGLVLMLAIAVGAISLVAGFLAYLFGRGAGVFGAAFIVCLGLVVGIAVGAEMGRSNEVGGWAKRPTPTRPTFSFVPGPPIYEANGKVTLSLKDVSAFTQPDLQPYGDGLFTHWCTSEPGAKVLSTVSAGEAGAIDGRTVQAEVRLTDPSGTFAEWSVAIPRVTITAMDAQGQTTVWSGPATVTESGTTHGRLTFTRLPVDPAYHSDALPATLSGELTWQCGIWRNP